MSARSQSGNAIVLILISIALFGALAAVFMRGAKSGQGNLNSHQATMAAQEIIDYGKALDNKVNKLRQKGCSEEQLSFTNTFWTNVAGTALFGPSHNAKAPGDGRCDVFASSFAAMVLPEKYTGAAGVTMTNTDIKLGSSSIYVLKVPGVGVTGTDDLAWVVPWVNIDVCMKINTILGVSNATSAPPSHTGNIGTLYAGTITSTSTFADSGSAFITGKTAFCANDGSVNRYFHVLIPR